MAASKSIRSKYNKEIWLNYKSQWPTWFLHSRLCLSISDFHPDTWVRWCFPVNLFSQKAHTYPESWDCWRGENADFSLFKQNPAWSVSTILTGLLSFMVENTPTSGSTESSDATVRARVFFKMKFLEQESFCFNLQKRRLALDSLNFNLQDKIFCELFPEIVDEIHNTMHKKPSEPASTSDKFEPSTGSALETRPNWLIVFTNNLIVIVGVAVFGLVVKYVLNTISWLHFGLCLSYSIQNTLEPS
jgi:hypothetical protein